MTSIINIPVLRLAVNRRLVDSYAGVPYLKRRGSMQSLLPSTNSDVLIDGFPRSAGSFAYYAFQVANVRRTVKGHTHSSDVIRKAIHFGVPTILLVREPIGCLASFTQFVPDLSVHTALLHYRRFYRCIAPLTPMATVGTFDEVTTNFGSVIDRTNRKFDTDFATYEDTPQNKSQVTRMLEQANQHYSTGTELTAARPSKSRRSPSEVFEDLTVADRRLLTECQHLYRQVSGVG